MPSGMPLWDKVLFRLTGGHKFEQAISQFEEALEKKSPEEQHQVSLLSSFYDPNLQGWKTWEADKEEQEMISSSLDDAEERALFAAVEGMPPPLAKHHARVMHLLKGLGVPQDQWEEKIKEWDISEGQDSLEWCLPNPCSWHTFDELPICKE
jgi:hypothetical protein